MILPDKVVNLHNTSQTFKPYNPNDAQGDTTPTLPKEPQPPAPKKHGCGVGQIIVAIIAIAVTAIVAPYAIEAVAGHTITGTFAAVSAAAAETVAGSSGLAFAVAGGAVAGAAGSIVSQTFAVATGIQSKFNWAAVATAAIGGGVGGAFAGTFSGINSPFLEGMVRGAVSNVVTQGVSMAVGLQKKFDWTSVAVAGVAGGVANSVAEWAHGPQKEVNGTKQYDQRGKPVYEARQVGEFTENVLVGTASLLASAATKSLITGQDFGKSIREVLPDAIASTVGNMIGEALKAEIQDSKSNRASELKIKPKTADDDPVLDTEKLGPSQYFDVDTTMPELPTLVKPWSGKYTLKSGQTITDISRASLLAQGYTKDQITQALILKQNLAIMADNNILKPSQLGAGTKLMVRGIEADRDPAMLKIASRNYGRDNAAVQQRRDEIAAAQAAAAAQRSYEAIWAVPAFSENGGLFNKSSNFCPPRGPWTSSGNTPSSSIEAHMDIEPIGWKKVGDYAMGFTQGGAKTVVNTIMDMAIMGSVWNENAYNQNIIDKGRINAAIDAWSNKSEFNLKGQLRGYSFASVAALFLGEKSPPGVLYSSSKSAAVALEITATKAAVPEGIVYLRTDVAGKLEPYGGQAISDSRYLARQIEHARAFPESEFKFAIVDRANPGVELDIAEHRYIQEMTGGIAARRSSIVSNQRDPVGKARRQTHGLPEPK